MAASTITIYHLAKFFEDEQIQAVIWEAMMKNKLEYSGFVEAKDDVVIRKSVDSLPPPPPIPIFLMKSYALQSYLSILSW